MISLTASPEPSVLKVGEICALNQEEWMLADIHYRKGSLGRGHLTHALSSMSSHLSDKEE